jgi:Tfp pilus assembly protein PilE
MMSTKIKTLLQVTIGIAVILAALWYLAYQFSSIETKLNQVVKADIPKLKNTLEKNAEMTDTLQTDMHNLTQELNDLGDQVETVKNIETNVDLLSKKINEELIAGISQLEQESVHNTKEVQELAQKIDNLSRQYVKFLKLSEDKITVSIPPKWVDALPYRDGTVFSVGISPSTKELQKSQKRAVEQALTAMTTLLERKTFNAVAYTIRSAGKTPPTQFEELSEQFKGQITEAINELLLDFRVESYWVDPAGYVYALISLPIEDRIQGSQFSMLIETLKLTQLSVTEALKQDFEKHLQIELLK